LVALFLILPPIYEFMSPPKPSEIQYTPLPVLDDDDDNKFTLNQMDDDKFDLQDK